MSYRSYLLRLWRVNGGQTPLWRASLQRPGATETIALAGLDALLAFLRAGMEAGEAAEPLERAQAPQCPASRPWAEPEERTGFASRPGKECL